jgi:hypothetical protein
MARIADDNIKQKEEQRNGIDAQEEESSECSAEVPSEADDYAQAAVPGL